MSDYGTAGYIEFYFHYNIPEHIDIRSWSGLNGISDIADREIYVFINRVRAHFIRDVHRVPIPAYIRRQEGKWQLIDEKDGIKWYEVALN